MSISDSISQKFKNFLGEYSGKVERAKTDYKKAIKVSINELSDDVYTLLFQDKDKVPRKLLLLTKDLIGSGIWVGHSYIRYLKSLSHITNLENNFLNDPVHEHIIECVLNRKNVRDPYIDNKDIFKSIFEEIRYTFLDPSHQSRLEFPQVKVTVVLVSGVFNELFKTDAFERGVEYVSRKYGIKYICPKVNGAKSAQHNSMIIRKTLEDYIEKNPSEKLWILAYSKGGIDSLHFLGTSKKFSKKYIVGLSTIASPILGSEKTEHRAMKFYQLAERLADTSLYEKISKGKDLILRELKDSLSNKIQGSWFTDHSAKLPKGLFYTSIALQAKWHESHFWMILTKIFFINRKGNDGVVDIDQARFPDYFPAIDLGIIQGHHLVGSRSSFFSQEALIEAHIIYLHYLGLLKS